MLVLFLLIRLTEKSAFCSLFAPFDKLQLLVRGKLIYAAGRPWCSSSSCPSKSWTADPVFSYVMSQDQTECGVLWCVIVINWHLHVNTHSALPCSRLTIAFRWGLAKDHSETIKEDHIERFLRWWVSLSWQDFFQRSFRWTSSTLRWAQPRTCR